MWSIRKSTPYGSWRMNPETAGWVTPTEASILARLSELVNAVYGTSSDDELGLAALTCTVEEGYFDPKTGVWNDQNGGNHTQRCNLRKIIESGSAPDAPDAY